MRRAVLVVAIAFVVVGLVCFAWRGTQKRIEAIGGAPSIVFYTGENFTGRSLTIEGRVFDFPRQEDPDGSFFDWNDRVRSMIVISGTWRLYQHGRCNTLLDDTELVDFNLQAARPVDGWSTLVSATSVGQLQIPELSAGGLSPDISSVELVSSENLPDWAMVWRP